MNLKDIVETQEKAWDDVKREFTKYVGEIPHSTELDTLMRLRKDFDARSRKIKEKPEYEIQSVYREQNGGKEWLTFHMNTTVKDDEDKAEFFHHYGKFDVPQFRKSRMDIEGKPIYDIEDRTTKYFIEFSKKSWEDIKQFAQDAKLYIKTRKGLAYGPFPESDWLGKKFDDLEFGGKTGNVSVTDGRPSDE